MNETLKKLERENIRLASFSKRVLAYIIDNLIISAIILLIFADKLMGFDDITQIQMLMANFLGGILLLQFAYDFVFTFLYGATLGKMACKISIVDESSLYKPNITQSAIRAGVKRLSDGAFALGFVWALGNDLRKAWEDYAAKTLVIELA